MVEEASSSHDEYEMMRGEGKGGKMPLPPRKGEPQDSNFHAYLYDGTSSWVHGDVVVLVTFSLVLAVITASERIGEPVQLQVGICLPCMVIGRRRMREYAWMMDCGGMVYRRSSIFWHAYMSQLLESQSYYVASYIEI